MVILNHSKDVNISNIILDYVGINVNNAEVKLIEYLQAHQLLHDAEGMHLQGSHVCLLHWKSHFTELNHWKLFRKKDINHISELESLKQNAKVYLLIPIGTNISNVMQRDHLLMMKPSDDGDYFILEWCANNRKIQTQELLYKSSCFDNF